MTYVRESKTMLTPLGSRQRGQPDGGKQTQSSHPNHRRGAGRRMRKVVKRFL